MRVRSGLKDVQLQELKEAIKVNKLSSGETKRYQAILLLQSRSNDPLIEPLTGYEIKYAFRLRKKYLEGGLSALADRKRKAPKELLTKDQLKQIEHNLLHSTPKAFGFETVFWSVPILAEMIKRNYGVQYKSKTSLYILFKRAKFTFHKPDTKYDKHSQERIDKWVKSTKPVLKKLLKQDDVVILTGDEMFLSNVTTTQKIWLPKGEFPKIECATKRESSSFYGFLNIQSGVEHVFKTDKQTSEITCDILEKIGKLYPKKRIVIFWDNASWHKSKKVTEYLTTTKNRFEIIWFPPYSPELNPQEHVWKAARSNVTHNEYIRDFDKTSNAFLQYLHGSIFKYKFLGMCGK